MPKKIDTPEMRELLRTLHLDRGMSAVAIGKKIGHDNQTVQRILEDMGIYQKGRSGTVFSALPIDEIYARYQGGELLPKLAEEFGVHYSSLHRYLKRNGYRIDSVGQAVSKRARISAVEFVAIWQSAEELDEVMVTLFGYGYTLDEKTAVCQRAAKYRRRGVPLKRMIANRVDWDSLREMAELLLFDEDDEEGGD